MEEAVRGQVRSFIEQLLEEELEAALGRCRYERVAGANGRRHGYRPRQLVTTFGPLSLSVPRARLHDAGGEQEWKSTFLPAYKRLSHRAEALIAEVYLAGMNTRRARRALAKLLLQRREKRRMTKRQLAGLANTTANLDGHAGAAEVVRRRGDRGRHLPPAATAPNASCRPAWPGKRQCNTSRRPAMLLTTKQLEDWVAQDREELFQRAYEQAAPEAAAAQALDAELASVRRSNLTPKQKSDLIDRVGYERYMQIPFDDQPRDGNGWYSPR